MPKSPNNREAFVTFIARKAEFDALLSRLADLSRDHFNQMPDDVSWADVGILGSYVEQLGGISNAAFHDGEHA